jgi:hypothetical protein
MQLRKTKAIKHSKGVVAYFCNHLNPNLSQWKEGSHNFYLWLRVSRGVTLDLFVCMVYIALVGFKHESESLFQNLLTDIVEVQTRGGIILLGGDFNARTTMLPNTIDTNDLCEMLQAPKLIETKQPNVVVKQQNHDASVGGWGRELLDLCWDVGLFILNGWTPSDESKEFTCLANGGHNIVDYIVDSIAIWETATHLEVI